MDRAAQAFAAYEKANPPGGGRYIDVGVIRLSLCLVSEKMRSVGERGRHYSKNIRSDPVLSPNYSRLAGGCALKY